MRSIFKFKKVALFLLLLLFSIIYFSLSTQTVTSTFAGDSTMDHPDFNSVSVEKWKSLSSKKIFFGHHSVGENIISGMMKIDGSSPHINLNIVETMDPAVLTSAGIFAHGDVGHNFEPLSKIAAFKSVMDNGLGNKVDIAFMKFCFVDIGTESDLTRIFTEYKSTLKQLGQTYPDTTFVHVTVPLFVEPSGMKSQLKLLIKKLLGRNNYYENTAKARLNSMIRAEYAGKEPLFDLAAFEATRPDGSKLTFKSGGIEYEALVPEYSSDGGHLNSAGQEVLAKALLAFLANLD